MKFGHLIRQYREECNLTREHLADQVGISHTYMCQIEKNTNRPGRDVAQRLIDTLALSEERSLMILSFYAQLPSPLIDRVIIEAIDAGDASYEGIRCRLLPYRVEAARAGMLRAGMR